MTKYGPRLSFINPETMKKYPQFTIEVFSSPFKDGSSLKFRAKDYSVITLIKLLDSLKRSEVLSFSALYTESKIRMKRSFMNYLNFCRSSEFVSRTEKQERGSKAWVYYSLTPKGEVFLSLFC